MRQYPGAEIVLVVGTDMLLFFEEWHDFRWLMQHVTVAAFARNAGDEEKLVRHASYLNKTYGAHVICLEKRPLPMSSTQIRALLRGTWRKNTVM